MKVNYIHGLHALLQQLIDQGRMPISETVQQYVNNSRNQLREIIAANTKGASGTDNQQRKCKICPDCGEVAISIGNNNHLCCCNPQW